MKKQTYQKPAMKVVKLQHTQTLLAGSGVTDVNSGDTGIGFGGGGNGGARARQYNGGIDWDDWDE